VLVPYYLCIKKQKTPEQVIPKHPLRPRPQGGQGWRKGGDFIAKIWFSPEQKIDVTGAVSVNQAPVDRDKFLNQERMIVPLRCS
jgi:hypothetical protein